MESSSRILHLQDPVSWGDKCFGQGSHEGSFQANPANLVRIIQHLFKRQSVGKLSSVSSTTDIWQGIDADTKTTLEEQVALLVSDLQWTREEALETRMRLRTFEEDWNSPDMEAYDEL